MGVLAKFQVYEKTEHHYGGDRQMMVTIKMRPVFPKWDGEKKAYIASDENKKFWEASPSGDLQLGCINLEAAAQFQLGKEYYLEFTEAKEQ